MVLLTISIALAQLCQNCGRIGHLAVDFATAGIHCYALAHQLGQSFAAATNELSNQQPRNHTAVAAREVAEIMVSAPLATVEHIIIAHTFLHEGMTALATHGHAPITL